MEKVFSKEERNQVDITKQENQSEGQIEKGQQFNGCLILNKKIEYVAIGLTGIIKKKAVTIT